MGTGGSQMTTESTDDEAEDWEGSPDGRAERMSRMRAQGAPLQEIADVFGLTRERVRQIKEKAIRRLKHTSRSKILKTYLG